MNCAETCMHACPWFASCCACPALWQEGRAELHPIVINMRMCFVHIVVTTHCGPDNNKLKSIAPPSCFMPANTVWPPQFQRSGTDSSPAVCACILICTIGRVLDMHCVKSELLMHCAFPAAQSWCTPKFWCRQRFVHTQRFTS